MYTHIKHTNIIYYVCFYIYIFHFLFIYVYQATMTPDGNNRVFSDFDNQVHDYENHIKNMILISNYEDSCIW